MIAGDSVDIEFERTMGCTAAELLAWLPAALPGAAVTANTSACRAEAVFADGTLTLAWRTLPPRRIALLAIPCLHVRFSYAGLSPQRRCEVQRRFDLATLRGGG
jgi:hypothetical protein